ncbi:MAG: rRNA synthase [Solirubrobacteraceae bacterium]|nr:rRNA synthase [Solirubrobacteraceae bacterium]
MRLGKFLAHAGIASRRRAEDLVRAGRVSIDGITVRDPARDVDETSGVAVDGKPVSGAEAHVIWALHKPAGVVSTAKDTHGRRTVLDLLPQGTKGRLYPVGRLDADTTGLILLTNDGELANRLMHPSFEVPKTYRVRVARPPLREGALHALRNGVELEDGMTAPALVRRLRADQLDITIHEGRKRQVRRMCDAVGHPVKEIERIAFGPLRLGTLPRGQARRLTTAETQRLRGLT